MIWHPVIFSASLGNSANLQAVAAIRDGVLTLDGTNYFLVPQPGGTAGAPALTNIIRAYGRGTTIGRMQIFSPSLSQKYLPEVAPLDKGGPVAGQAWKIDDYSLNPIGLVATEDLGVNIRQDAAGAETEYGVLFLSDSAPAPVKGVVNSVRATISSTLTAGAWTTGLTLTMDQALKAGTYQLVGARAKSATGIVFRFLFSGAFYRPAGIMVTNYNDVDPDGQRNGNWGVWGTFTNTTLPTVDIFATGADTSVELVLDLVGPGAGAA